MSRRPNSSEPPERLHPDAAAETLAQPIEQEQVLVGQGRPGPPPHNGPQFFEEAFVVGRQVGQGHAQDRRYVLGGIPRPRGVERVDDPVTVAGQHGLEARAVPAADSPQGLAAQALPDQGLHAQRNEELRQAEDVRMRIQDFRYHGGAAAPGGKHQHRVNPFCRFCRHGEGSFRASGHLCGRGRDACVVLSHARFDDPPPGQAATWIPRARPPGAVRAEVLTAPCRIR